MLQQCGVADCTQKQLSRFGKVPCLDDQPASKKREREKSVLEENSDTRENIHFCGFSLSLLFLGIYLEILYGEVSAKKVVASFGFLCRFSVRISHGGDYSRNFVITIKYTQILLSFKSCIHGTGGLT